jgi:hypothetical protein
MYKGSGYPTSGVNELGRGPKSPILHFSAAWSPTCGFAENAVELTFFARF